MCAFHNMTNNIECSLHLPPFFAFAHPMRLDCNGDKYSHKMRKIQKDWNKTENGSRNWALFVGFHLLFTLSFSATTHCLRSPLLLQTHTKMNADYKLMIVMSMHFTFVCLSFRRFVYQSSATRHIYAQCDLYDLYLCICVRLRTCNL